MKRMIGIGLIFIAAMISGCALFERMTSRHVAMPSGPLQMGHANP
jgi:hypothetical protein